MSVTKPPPLRSRASLKVTMLLVAIATLVFLGLTFGPNSPPRVLAKTAALELAGPSVKSTDALNGVDTLRRGLGAIQVGAIAARNALTDAISGSRADADLDRRHLSFPNAVFEVLPDFASTDGSYDLIVHFHGGGPIVAAEFGSAHLNAVMAIVNLGLGSAMYDQRYVGEVMFPAILRDVQDTMIKRGLKNASRRKLAVTAWSAGYGAVRRVLEEPGMSDKIDTIVLLDAIHTALILYPTKRPDTSKLTVFADFARQAIANKKLFFITHSEIDPIEFVGTHKTTDLLLKEVGVTRMVANDATPHPKSMELLTEAHAGGFSVQGYSGEKKEDHIAQISEAADTALPELRKRWANP
jgi:hypothetical protein